MSFLLPDICAWCGNKPTKLKKVSTATQEITAEYIVAYKYITHHYSLSLPMEA